MHKSDRQNVLLELISVRRITKQRDLVEMLRNDGFGVTQASVSRDLDELGIGKIDGAYSLLTRRPRGSSNANVTSIELAGDTLLVVKTRSGLASAAAVRIDDAKVEGIIGTIAGDDTIFIAVAGETEQTSVKRQLDVMFAASEAN